MVGQIFHMLVCISSRWHYSLSSAPPPPAPRREHGSQTWTMNANERAPQVLVTLRNRAPLMDRADAAAAAAISINRRRRVVTYGK